MSGAYHNFLCLLNLHFMLKLLLGLGKSIQSWIFSRIIESVWWQTLTPYMQSAATKAIIRIVDSESSNKSFKKTSTPCTQEQANFSMESFGRPLSWMLVKEFVRFELEDMIVVACLFFLNWTNSNGW